MAKENKEPQGMVLYVDKLLLLRRFLPPEQMGECIFALLDYFTDGVFPCFNDNIMQGAFDVLKDMVDRGKEAYNAKVEGGKFGSYRKTEIAAGREPIDYTEWKNESIKNKEPLSAEQKALKEKIDNAVRLQEKMYKDT